MINIDFMFYLTNFDYTKCMYNFTINGIHGQRDMKKTAHAKLNIGLDIVNRREDGYHELDMVFLELEFGDELEIEKTDGGIFLDCIDSENIDLEKNLAYRAAKLMIEKYQISGGVSIKLIKKTPSMAGLGGGSSDAAYVMKAINELYGLGLSGEDMIEDGKSLGADVPFFLIGGCARAKGIGEKLTSIGTFPECSILLAKPDEAVSTPWAFKAYDEMDERMELEHKNMELLEEQIKGGNLIDVCEAMGNSLEYPIVSALPIINQLKADMVQLGAKGSMMTGSGSCVFGLFDEEEKAAKAMAAIKSKYNIFTVVTRSVMHQ